MRKNIIIVAVLVIGVFGFSCNKKANPNESVKTTTSEVKHVSSYNLKFIGQGNEPAWKVVVTENEIVYTSLNLKGELVFKNVQINPIMDIAGVGYSGTDKTGNTITVQAIKKDCSDTMADKTWPFQVSVTMAVAQEENGLKGCGEYVADERLAGIWYLKTLNGKKVKVKNENKKPQMELVLNSNKVSANMGCNGIGGGFSLMNNTLYFDENFMSTQMYCEGVMELETEFTKSLVSKSLKYTFENHNLVLTDYSGKVVMTFSQD